MWPQSAVAAVMSDEIPSRGGCPALCSLIGHTFPTSLSLSAVIGFSASLPPPDCALIGSLTCPRSASNRSCNFTRDSSSNMSKDTDKKSDKIMDMECEALWYPDAKKDTQMDRCRTRINRDFGLNLANYQDLYQWSVDNYPEFWAQVWNCCGVVCSKPYEEVVDTSKRISDVPEWFRGARLNYAENLLKHEDQDKVALYAATEKNEEIVKVTFGELRREVALFAAAMRKMGIQSGDRVVGECSQGSEGLAPLAPTQ
uniref:Acetyl-coenzyme A synthetase N-terminal domain-containing protein n=1 Tax=Knipowitschia caucasica TaxID=637954 RepID=A0AAV2MNV8_KNICA